MIFDLRFSLILFYLLRSSIFSFLHLSSRLVSSCLASPRFVSPRLVSSRLVSSSLSFPFRPVPSHPFLSLFLVCLVVALPCGCLVVVLSFFAISMWLSCVVALSYRCLAMVAISSLSCLCHTYMSLFFSVLFFFGLTRLHKEKSCSKGFLSVKCSARRW